MKTNPLAVHINKSSPIVFGCMGLGGGWDNNPIDKQNIKQAHEVIDTAIEAGITLFDHADIYTLGKAEQVFGEVFKQRPDLRNEIAIQSKCAIRFDDASAPKRYDFSGEWINESVNGILTRLNTEQIEVLMLHRPDPLMEPEEISQVFQELQSSGKVKHFGVSNMQQHQMRFLQQSLDMPLVSNQIELSLRHLDWLEEGVTAGCSGQPVVNFSSGTIEYCQTNAIQIQAWGCLAQGLFSGRDISNEAEHIKATAELVSRYANEMNVSNEAIVLAWLMRHPANIQPIIGTTNLERIKASAQATKVQLTREQWYTLYVTARGHELP